MLPIRFAISNGKQHTHLQSFARQSNESSIIYSHHDRRCGGCAANKDTTGETADDARTNNEISSCRGNPWNFPQSFISILYGFANWPVRPVARIRIGNQVPTDIPPLFSHWTIVKPHSKARCKLVRQVESDEYFDIEIYARTSLVIYKKCSRRIGQSTRQPNQPLAR